MKRIKRFVLLVLANFFSIINQVIPKKNEILFFTNMVDFNDNNRALFEHMLASGLNEKYRIFYSTPIPHEFIVARNVNYIGIPQGLIRFLFCKYVFYDGGTTKIKPSRSQVVLSLWHGTPLKRLGRKTEKSVKIDRFNDFTYILTTSENCKGIFADSFECPLNRVIVAGYPRNDFLFSPARNIVKGNYKKRVLWMPTFRQSLRDGNKVAGGSPCGISLFRHHDDLYALDEFLQQHEVFLAIKHHPLSVQNNARYPEFRNIQIINNTTYRELNVQNYSFVGAFDCLITDYSSVYFDYLLLNRPIGFVIEDIERYRNTRGFTFENPLEMMPGEIIQTKDDFLAFIRSLDGVDEYEARRLELRDFIHSKVQDNSACERILEFVGIKRESACE